MAAYRNRKASGDNRNRAACLTILETVGSVDADYTVRAASVDEAFADSEMPINFMVWSASGEMTSVHILHAALIRCARILYLLLLVSRAVPIRLLLSHVVFASRSALQP